MRLLDLLAVRDRAYTDTCACGGTIVIGTDGDGRSTEYCVACARFTATPRGSPAVHPLLAAHEKEIVEARAAIELARAALPLCVDDCGRHVGPVRADRCAECSLRVRRIKNRLAMRIAGGHAARAS